MTQNQGIEGKLVWFPWFALRESSRVCEHTFEQKFTSLCLWCFHMERRHLGCVPSILPNPQEWRHLTFLLPVAQPFRETYKFPNVWMCPFSPSLANKSSKSPGSFHRKEWNDEGTAGWLWESSTGSSCQTHCLRRKIPPSSLQMLLPGPNCNTPPYFKVGNLRGWGQLPAMGSHSVIYTLSMAVNPTEQ